MTSAADLRTGKGHRDENFPVASNLIHPRHRGVILAFYDFVRTADDVADNSQLSETQKIELLDRLEATLLGDSDAEPVGVRLRAVLAPRRLSPRHAQDLLTAFRLDATKRRYRDWEDLIDYCAYSAMPVGRFVLDVHGEDRSTWITSDKLCAALQIINHLQDCGKDFRNLDRVYVPLDAFAAAGASVEQLDGSQATPELRACLVALTNRTAPLLEQSIELRGQVEDLRLSLEISVIQAYARRIIELLRVRDPLSEKVHLSKAQFAGIGLGAITAGLLRRIGRPRSSARAPQDA
jgi:hydroxysqualene synthase